MTNTEAVVLLAYARGAARKICNRMRLEHLADDAAQHAVLQVLERPDGGNGRNRLREAVLDYLRRWLGCSWSQAGGKRLRRLRTPLCELPLRLASQDGSASAPERSIMLWRVQRIYPTLTEIQRDVLLMVLSGEDVRGESSDSAEEKNRRARLNTSKKNTLLRIDRIREYTRVATQKHLSSEDRRAIRALRAREKRAKKAGERGSQW